MEEAETEKKKSKWAGIPMTEEEKKEVEEDMRIMQESMEHVLKYGKNV